MTLACFVINLASSTDRRDVMHAQLNRLGIAHTFFDAVRGADLPDAEINRIYARTKRNMLVGHDLTKSELGCLLSHRGIYQKMVDENIPQALILEDDAIINDDIQDVLNAISQMPEKWDMIRFLHRKKVEKQSRKIRPLYGPYKLVRPRGTPGGAYAYILTLNAAKSLLKHTQRNWLPIDILHGYVWQTGLNVYAISPSPIRPDLETPSTIGDARFQKQQNSLNFLQKLAYPATRMGFKLYEACFKTVTRLKNPA